VKTALSFKVPRPLLATEPPEARGVARDGVRMLVAQRHDALLRHARFHDLPDVLGEDDLLVVNTSATMPACVDGTGVGTGELVVLHLSTYLSTGPEAERWVVEPRRPAPPGTSKRWAHSATGDSPPRLVDLPGGAQAQLLERYGPGDRLWVAGIRVPAGACVRDWLSAHGRPVRYDYVAQAWPLAYYQTVFAHEPGSAEMPSAGRPFTAATVLALLARGVGIAPIVLHTGVSSLEAGELPYPERARVPAATARRVNDTRDHGGRVVAVGTTVVRALESAYDEALGRVAGFEGWADLVVTPESGVRAVDALLTGWHEPEASHLLMLEAVAGPALLEKAYRASLAEGYLWHEFGDVALFLP
jgi:S-adenosylmethionine:tRNA ribosyltransferase-isomerase